MDRQRRRDDRAALLRSLVGSGGVSATSLGEIIATLQQRPDVLNDLHRNRLSIGDSLLEQFDRVKRVVHLQTSGNGEDFRWEFIDPSTMLSEVVRANRQVASAYEEALRCHPPSRDNPWELIVGFDEFSPGNKLRVDNRRKVMVLSYTFRQLGASAMANGDLWLTPIAVRSCKMHEVHGGWSRMLTEFLRLVLLGPSGLCTAGWVIDVPSGPVAIFGRLGNLLTDGDGWRLAFDWRGHASLKPCFRHWNVLRKHSDLAWRRPGYCEITCSDPSQFREWKASDIHEAVDVLVAAADRVEVGAMSRTRFAEIEQAYGLNLNKHGLLAATDLRSIASEQGPHSHVSNMQHIIGTLPFSAT